MLGLEPAISHLSDRCFNSLSYHDFVENEAVTRTLYTVMLVDFQDFGIVDLKQYFQGPKLKLLENNRPTACYFQWNS